MGKSSNVCILMSTYNGEKYLSEQLQSIYTQAHKAISLVVRDDGSNDNTTLLLQQEQEAGRLTWYTGENKGPAWSFWDLLLHAPESDYYAFSDQDDFWLADKLSTAVSRLQVHAQDEPCLYFCQTQLTDAKLCPIENVTISPLLTYGEALVAQFIGGCTMVFNKKLKNILTTYTPQTLFMHDFWIYNVALALDAHVEFDRTPHILYRQHSQNAIGQANSPFFVWRSRIKRLWENKHIRSCTAQDLWNGYYEYMTPINRQLTLWAANYRESLRAEWHLLTNPAYHTFSKKTDIYRRISVLLHIF